MMNRETLVPGGGLPCAVNREEVTFIFFLVTTTL